MRILSFENRFKEQAVALILGIQNEEAGINLPIAEQPDLFDIERSYIKSGGGFWVAVDGEGDVVGTIGVIKKENGCGVLKKFFVRSDFRGKKVGYNLYKTLLSYCEEQGICRLILDTPAVAEASHRFYERNGFRRITKSELPIKYEYPDRNSYLYLLELN